MYRPDPSDAADVPALPAPDFGPRNLPASYGALMVNGI